MQVSCHLYPPALSSYLSAPVLAAASLELKTEKQSYVCSAAFSPDGKTIVSGSGDKTLKVWDAGVSTDTLQPLAQI